MERAESETEVLGRETEPAEMVRPFAPVIKPWVEKAPLLVVVALPLTKILLEADSKVVLALPRVVRPVTVTEERVPTEVRAEAVMLLPRVVPFKT